MTAEWLEWRCDSCGTPIADDDGCIRMPFSEIHAQWDRVKQYRAAQRAGSAPDPAALESAPAKSHWLIQHSVCRSQEDDGYEIDIERIRTTDEVQWWTRHLRSKNWVPFTDWDVLVTDIGKGNRVVVRQPRGGAV